MPEPIGEHNIDQYLSAFADGELDAAQNVEVLRYLSAHPEAFALMEQEQRLRVAARRVIRRDTPAASDELKAKLLRLADSGSAASRDIRRPSLRYRALWAAGLAIVSFVGGALLTQYAFKTAPMQPARTEPSAGVVAPVALIEGATRIHVECSRFAATVHTSEFPRSLGELAESLQADLGRDKPYPDLSKAGYEMVGVGPCKKPLRDTVHLLYHSTREDLDDTVSVFVQPYVGQMEIQPGVAYLVSSSKSQHPMFVWRTEKVLYALLGDDAETVRRILDFMGVRTNV